MYLYLHPAHRARQNVIVRRRVVCPVRLPRADGPALHSEGRPHLLGGHPSCAGVANAYVHALHDQGHLVSLLRRAAARARGHA